MAQVDFNIFDDIGEKDFKAEEYTLKCMSCDEDLMSIARVGEAATPIKVLKDGRVETKIIEEQKFQCNCPFCNSNSWVVSAKGRIAWGPVEGKTTFVDVDMNEEDNLLFNKVTLGKI